MTNKKLITVLVALMFAGLGAYVAPRDQNAAPSTPATPAAPAPGPASGVAPAPAAASTPEAAAPVLALYAQNLPDADGARQALAQWKGKTLLVNFWAPWCAPCVEEMPELSALQRENSAKNIQIIGIGIDSAANISQFAAKLKIAYPLYVAGMEGTDLARQFGNSAGGLPYTVLIGADGRIRKTYLGRLKFEQVRADLSSM